MKSFQSSGEKVCKFSKGARTLVRHQSSWRKQVVPGLFKTSASLTTGSAPTLFCDLVAAMKITGRSTYYKVVTHEEGGKLGGERGEKQKAN